LPAEREAHQLGIGVLLERLFEIHGSPLPFPTRARARRRSLRVVARAEIARESPRRRELQRGARRLVERVKAIATKDRVMARATGFLETVSGERARRSRGSRALELLG
jgi:hypothetical protein